MRWEKNHSSENTICRGLRGAALQCFPSGHCKLPQRLNGTFSAAMLLDTTSDTTSYDRGRSQELTTLSVFVEINLKGTPVHIDSLHNQEQSGPLWCTVARTQEDQGLPFRCILVPLGGSRLSQKKPTDLSHQMGCLLQVITANELKTCLQHSHNCCTRDENGSCSRRRQICIGTHWSGVDVCWKAAVACMPTLFADVNANNSDVIDVG